MKGSRETVLIHGLRRQGPGISAIARRVGPDRGTVRGYPERGPEAPVYGPRALRGGVLDPYRDYPEGRVRNFPDPSGRRPPRGIRSMGHEGGHPTPKPFSPGLRPPRRAPSAVRSGTPPGRRARVDFAGFRVGFTDGPGVIRRVRPFSPVPGHSRRLRGRSVSGRSPRTVMRRHIAPLNRYGSAPGARKPYRARTKGRVERPFRYIRRDLFPARTFRNTDDPDARSDAWRHGIASPRVQATAERVVDEAFGGGRPAPGPSLAIPRGAVPAVERRVGHGGMVPVDGGHHPVPGTARERAAEARNHVDGTRIPEDGTRIARHPAPGRPRAPRSSTAASHAATSGGCAAAVTGFP